MTLVKYNYQPVNLFEKIFDDFISNNVKYYDYNIPLIDVIENDNDFEVHLQMTGIKKDDININVENNTLIVSAERKINKDLNYILNEIYYGKYQKKIKLPKNINVDDISASMEDGILSIKIPKLENTKKIIKIE